MGMGIRSAAVAAAVCVAAGAARADTLKAPTTSYESIQAALDAAEPGDTVLVLAGEHDESPVLSGRSDITLRGSRKASIRGVTIVEGCTDIVVKGLTIDSNGEDGVFIDDSENVAIVGVEIQGSSDDGIQTENSSGVKIEKCFIHGVGGDGIESNGGHGIFVQKNRIEDVDGDAIDVGLLVGEWDEGEGAVVQKNKIEGAQNGIVAEGDGFLIFSNTNASINEVVVSHFSPSPDSNTRIGRNRVGVLIDDYGYPGPGASVGIQVQGSNTLIDGNILLGCGSGIIELGQGNRLEKNKITDADTAIDVSGDYTQIFKNTCRGGDTGIVTRGDFVIVDMNKITSPGGTGILVASGNVQTFRNRVSRAGSIGVHVLTSGNSFEGDRASFSEFFDHVDSYAEGVNSYEDCRFGTEQFNAD